MRRAIALVIWLNILRFFPTMKPSWGHYIPHKSGVCFHESRPIALAVKIPL
jgi:hypothetical protein